MNFDQPQNNTKSNAPGEARTHNLGLAQHTSVYKIRALADCATGALMTCVSNVSNYKLRLFRQLAVLFQPFYSSQGDIILCISCHLFTILLKI